MMKCHDCSEKATTKITVHYKFNPPDSIFYLCNIHAKKLVAFLENTSRKNGETFEVEELKEKVIFT